MPSARQALFLSALAIAFLGVVRASEAQVANAPPRQEKSGAELYRSACAACHGPDGKGAPRTLVGFETPLPDFTDCKFTSPEPDLDWQSTIHLGGGARAFDRKMPAFADALTDDEIDRVIGYMREFCTDTRWPRGDLNLPRPLVTEKAFPENEAVLTTAIVASRPDSIQNEFVYEHRIGSRSQYEVVVPVNLRQSEAGAWSRGLGDVAVAFKHAIFDNLRRGSILSAGSEVRLPTGKQEQGLGQGHSVVEPFAALSQALPRDLFLHVHAGVEFPLQSAANNEAFWRAVIGKTFVRNRWGRAWSPMVEVLGVRELATGEKTQWDLLPEMQVTLSRRQHIMINAGVRVPVNERTGRNTTVMMYFLWDWFDGGLFEGW